MCIRDSGYGVSVHRADCPNASPDKRRPEEADRWVKVSWVESDLPNYKTALELASKDRDGLTLDVAMALSAAKVKVTALSARSQPDGHATVNIVVEVKDKAELSAVIKMCIRDRSPAVDKPFGTPFPWAGCPAV